MALSILDGNQSATTLSTILSSGQHITAHTVVSLGTQAITDIVNATSANLTNTQLRASAVTIGGTVTIGNSVTISSLPAISGTVTANVFGQSVNGLTIFPIPIINYDEDISSADFQITVPVQINNINGAIGGVNPLPISGTVTIGSALPAGTNRIGVVTIGAGTVTIGAGTAQIGSVTVGNSVTIGSLPAISGTVTAVLSGTSYVEIAGGIQNYVFDYTSFPISGTVTANPTGTQTIAGSVTIGAGTAQIGSVTASISNFPATQAVSLTTLPALVAGTAQIGSVTASISGTVPISISSVTVGNSVTIGSLPALAAGTNQIGSVTASISNTAITIYSAQGTTVTNSNFTSTASTTLVSAVAGRDVLTVFNEGAGNLFISPGATATTISYQVRLSAGDYWECPEGQRSLIHTAVFATAGTARVTEVS